MANEFISDPNQFRWDPPAVTDVPADFIDGLQAVCGNGDASMKHGLCIYNYVCNQPMTQPDGLSGRVMCNADGEYLIVPHEGPLLIITEMGNMRIEICEIAVIPRGIKFAINPIAETGVARGYVLEVFKGRFELPNLGMTSILHTHAFSVSLYIYIYIFIYDFFLFISLYI